MNTKLTLSIDVSVIEKAKKYAKSNNKSLSKIIENYLKKIVKEESKSPELTPELTPIVKSIKGTFSPTGNFVYKSELKKKLFNKYIWSNENSN